MHKILVVDDELAIVKMLSSYFSSKYQILRAINGKTALKTLAQHNVDLVFLDWALPDIEGINILGKMRSSGDNTPVIMLTAKGTETDKLKAFAIGADDYLVKPFSLAELSARVNSILKRVGKKNVLTIANLSLDISNKSFFIDGVLIKLSSKEFELLKIFMVSPNKIFSREDLIHSIWKNKEISSRTVDVAINRVRTILKNHNIYNLLNTIHGMGYKFYE
jgi:DNA-binding response OmpR family regulator